MCVCVCVLCVWDRKRVCIFCVYVSVLVCTFPGGTILYHVLVFLHVPFTFSIIFHFVTLVVRQLCMHAIRHVFDDERYG